MPGSTKASAEPFSPQIHLFPAQTGSIPTTVIQESSSPAQGYLNIPPSSSLSHQPVPKLCQHSWSSNHPFNCCPDGVPVILICWQSIPFYMCSLAARTLSLEMLLMPVPAFSGQGVQVTHSPLAGGVGQRGRALNPSQGWACPPGKATCQSSASLCRAWDVKNGNPSCSGACPTQSFLPPSC